MNTATALTLAIEFLDLAHGGNNEDVNQVITRLGEILKQKGCEHFDPACDGTLPHLVDIVIDG